MSDIADGIIYLHYAVYTLVFLSIVGLVVVIFFVLKNKKEKKEDKKEIEEEPVIEPTIPIDTKPVDSYVPVSLTLVPLNLKCEPPVPDGKFCTKTYAIIASVKGGNPITDVEWRINSKIQDNKTLELKVSAGSTGFERDSIIACTVEDGKSEDTKSVKIC